jgi:intracellular sulfur oxidation DsrE/DsrF family protein
MPVDDPGIKMRTLKTVFMKNLILIMLLFLSHMAFAQTKPVRVIFDVTSHDTLTHQSVLRHVEGMANAYPDAMLEVVIYGRAWPMVVSSGSPAAHIVAELTQRKNVTFKICGLAMERFGIESSELIRGVHVVPDAIIEIVGKQNEGWGYIKESHN